MSGKTITCYRLHEYINGKWEPASNRGFGNREDAELNHGGQLLDVSRFTLLAIEVPITTAFFDNM